MTFLSVYIYTIVDHSWFEVLQWCKSYSTLGQSNTPFSSLLYVYLYCQVPYTGPVCVCVYAELGVRQWCCLPRRRMNNKCSLEFGSNVFRLLSRDEAFPQPSPADANDKI